MKNIAILSSHNGSGLDAIVEAVNAGTLSLNIALVISNNTDAKVLQKAKKYGITCKLINAKTDPDPDKAIYELLKEYACECVFLSGYMKKLSPQLTSGFTIINSHPSLLPKYGGAGMYGRFVHEAVIKNREKTSGVTIHEVNENYDEGKIILQKSLQIEPGESVDSLETRVKSLEKEAIVEGLALCLK
ncbi:phosphoribosylglycinamide formyltransferase [Sulfurimonas sp. SWIR-19]|uniref:phosphoribosylglycinamide formyltransferase n=1 Tax=Sulfurimonas sp. SWIR-19 TaxID=2878390 RepID=UPI001CF1B3DD|nr:phosphoribosylglycinamide formyltransferase [Sulfurimonas sp. SWIR-19]UCN00885.1 phosphoribosylglycinamide formyltransferase [Sulfurimonas sp. SWIR-19]